MPFTVFFLFVVIVIAVQLVIEIFSLTVIAHKLYKFLTEFITLYGVYAFESFENIIAVGVFGVSAFAEYHSELCDASGKFYVFSALRSPS